MIKDVKKIVNCQHFCPQYYSNGIVSSFKILSPGGTAEVTVLLAHSLYKTQHATLLENMARAYFVTLCKYLMPKFHHTSQMNHQHTAYGSYQLDHACHIHCHTSIHCHIAYQHKCSPVVLGESKLYLIQVPFVVMDLG